MTEIGAYYKLSIEGYIINPSDLKKIPSYATETIQNLKHDIIEKFDSLVEGIYLRGSIVQGHHVPNYSDIDTLILVPNHQIQKDLSNYLKSQQKYNVFDFGIYAKSDLNVKPVRMLFKCQSVCIHGHDICKSLEDFKPGPDMFYDLPYLKSDLVNAVNTLKNSSEEETKQLCKKITKVIIRVCFELVMQRDQKFTRALAFSIKSFLLYYPEKASEIHYCLRLHLNPISDRGELSEILNELGFWLVSEIELRYGKKIFID